MHYDFMVSCSRGRRLGNVHSSPCKACYSDPIPSSDPATHSRPSLYQVTLGGVAVQCLYADTDNHGVCGRWDGMRNIHVREVCYPRERSDKEKKEQKHRTSNCRRLLRYSHLLDTIRTYSLSLRASSHLVLPETSHEKDSVNAMTASNIPHESEKCSLPC